MERLRCRDGAADGSAETALPSSKRLRAQRRPDVPPMLKSVLLLSLSSGAAAFSATPPVDTCPATELLIPTAKDRMLAVINSLETGDPSAFAYVNQDPGGFTQVRHCELGTRG
eukprot:scaffold2172_cov130-Isochrysis_galbana.AAC.1